MLVLVLDKFVDLQSFSVHSDESWTLTFFAVHLLCASSLSIVLTNWINERSELDRTAGKISIRFLMTLTAVVAIVAVVFSKLSVPPAYGALLLIPVVGWGISSLLIAWTSHRKSEIAR